MYNRFSVLNRIECWRHFGISLNIVVSDLIVIPFSGVGVRKSLEISGSGKWVTWLGEQRNYCPLGRHHVLWKIYNERKSERLRTRLYNVWVPLARSVCALSSLFLHVLRPIRIWNLFSVVQLVKTRIDWLSITWPWCYHVKLFNRLFVQFRNLYFVCFDLRYSYSGDIQIDFIRSSLVLNSVANQFIVNPAK
jgi:hypothetical protein